MDIKSDSDVLWAIDNFPQSILLIPNQITDSECAMATLIHWQPVAVH